MITDNQRREVARKLREPKESLLAHPDEELIRLRYETGCQRGQDLYEHLADLIDPQTTPYICENVYDENECGACRNGFKCSVCGVTVEDCEGYYVHGTWNYCPKCRREVVKGGH